MLSYPQFRAGRWPLNLVRQGYRECLPACCAMLARTTLYYVLEFEEWDFLPDGSFGWDNAFSFLARHGVWCGCAALGWPRDHLDVSWWTREHGLLMLRWDEDETIRHAVVWDAVRRRILDPEYDAPRRRSVAFAGWTVEQFIPIAYSKRPYRS